MRVCVCVCVCVCKSVCLVVSHKARQGAHLYFTAIMRAQIPAQQTKGRQGKGKINTPSLSKTPSVQVNLEEDTGVAHSFHFWHFRPATKLAPVSYDTRGGTRTRHVLTERNHKTWHLHCCSALVVYFLLLVQVGQSGASLFEDMGCPRRVNRSTQSSADRLKHSSAQCLRSELAFPGKFQAALGCVPLLAYPPSLSLSLSLSLNNSVHLSCAHQRPERSRDILT